MDGRPNLDSTSEFTDRSEICRILGSVPQKDRATHTFFVCTSVNVDASVRACGLTRLSPSCTTSEEGRLWIWCLETDQGNQATVLATARWIDDDDDTILLVLYRQPGGPIRGISVGVLSASLIVVPLPEEKGFAAIRASSVDGSISDNQNVQIGPFGSGPRQKRPPVRSWSVWIGRCTQRRYPFSRRSQWDRFSGRHCHFLGEATETHCSYKYSI
jgi:hypothetical protein